MKFTPKRAIQTKRPIHSVIKSIVSLFILTRMSKCQKNKYFNVGSQPCSARQNPEFQSQMSRLLAERERQEFALSGTPSAPSAQPAPTKAAAATGSQGTQIVLVAAKTSKPLRTFDIDTILDGDA